MWKQDQAKWKHDLGTEGTLPPNEESDGGIFSAFGCLASCNAWTRRGRTPQAGSCRSEHEVLNQTRNGSWSVRSIEAGAYGASDTSRVGRRVAPPVPLRVWRLPPRWPGGWCLGLVFSRSTPRWVFLRYTTGLPLPRSAVRPVGLFVCLST